MYPEYLASVRIDTPDPVKETFYGEQIVAFYGFPKETEGQTTLALTIRYKNWEYERIVFPLSSLQGYWVFRLAGKEYWEKGGILSYKIELYDDECVIKTWTHHLFVDLIQIEC